MTNLVTCANCGKKFSRKAPKCPNCGVKYHICYLCTVPIVPNEKMIFITGEHIYRFKHVVAHGGTEIELFNEFGEKIRHAEIQGRYIHFSCLEPHFLSPEFVKCPDCGQRINCPKFSLEDFLFKNYSDIQGKLTILSDEDLRNKNYVNIKEKITINCSNCGNPDVLEISKLSLSESECSCCKLLIIPAIHNFTRQSIAYGYKCYHSFCN